MYVSPNLPIYPPLPAYPLVIMFVFYICYPISVLLICSFVACFKIPHVSCNIWYLSFSHLLWYSLGPSMLLQMALFYSCLWLSNIPLYICPTFSLCFSSVDGHLGCFRVLAIVNRATMNIGMHLSFWIMVFSRYVPRSGIADHMVTLFLVFWGNSILFFTLVHQHTFPPIV